MSGSLIACNGWMKGVLACIIVCIIGHLVGTTFRNSSSCSYLARERPGNNGDSIHWFWGRLVGRDGCAIDLVQCDVPSMCVGCTADFCFMLFGKELPGKQSLHKRWESRWALQRRRQLLVTDSM